MKNKLILIFAVIFSILFMGIFSAYTYSNPSYNMYNNAGGLGSFASYSGGKFDSSLCTAGTDFILQLNPFECESVPVRSDLLEENDVTVYCKISATQINPLIDVQSIRYITISGQYPQEIRSIGYFPSQSALGYTFDNTVNNPILENMGYVAITLRQNSNESSMPEYVQGNLTAKLKYDVQNAFGVGSAEFYLPVLNDDDYSDRINQYSFWQGRGFLRAESVDDESAVISIYSDINSVSGGASKQRVTQVQLDKGEISNEIYIPGFSSCLASMQLKLNDVQETDTRVRLKINSDYVEVSNGEKFLDEKCQIKSINKDGLNQKVGIYCKDDEKSVNFYLIISPGVKLNINGETKDYTVGDYLYTSEDNKQSVYLGYVGSKSDTGNLEDLFVVLIARSEYNSQGLSDDDVSEIAKRMNSIYQNVKKDDNALDILNLGVNKFFGGLVSFGTWSVEGENFYALNFKDTSVSAEEEFNGGKVSLRGYSDGINNDLVSSYEDSYELKKAENNVYSILIGGSDTGYTLEYAGNEKPKITIKSNSNKIAYFYGNNCNKQSECSEYVLDIGSIDSNQELFENSVSGRIYVNENKMTLKKIDFNSDSSELYREYYDNAINDFETIFNSYSGESDGTETSSETYGEKALYEEMILSNNLGQMKTLRELCQKFIENYPDSNKSLEICEDDYAISNTDVATREIYVNGKNKIISFEGIYEPGYNEYGAQIFVKGPNNQIKSYELSKGKPVYLSGLREESESSVSSSEYIVLESVDEDSAKVKIYVSGGELFNRLSNSYTLKLDESESFGSNFVFTLTETNIEKVARVSVVPSFNYQESNTTFSFKIAIEKRAIQLSDEQINNRIKSLNNSINDIRKVTKVLNDTNKILGYSCLATGGVLTIKNFIANSNGKSIARQKVMQGSGGWNEFCQSETAKVDSIYSSVDDCFFDNSDKIDEQVDEMYGAIQNQDQRIKAIQENIPSTNYLTNKVINESAFMLKYSKQGVNSLNGIGENGEFSVDGKEALNVDEMKEILSYEGWDNGNYNTEDLREIELYANLVNDPNVDSKNKKFYEEKLYSLLYDARVNAEDYVVQESFRDETGLGSSSALMDLEGKKTTEVDVTSYETFSSSNYKSYKLSDGSPAILNEDYVYAIRDKNSGKRYLVVYDSQGIVKNTYLAEGNSLSLYSKKDDKGNVINQNPLELTFKKYDESSYENEYKNPEVKYYEEELYAGYPAVVPLDTEEGWYAATKPVLGTGSSIASYDESGRVVSFWLCNVGENGLQEFSSLGYSDDECEQINLGTRQPYNQFAGLSESKTTRLVNNAVTSIESAQRAHKNGINNVRINGKSYKIGEPAVSVASSQCTDYMSPKDCKILFNVCDPVVCPNSRCDFGGAYPVQDVVQTGVIGSIVLCAPNAREGILLPVCTTGVQAGLESWTSVQESYRDCLQENLDTGSTVGVCDRIHSVYMCEFFWKQALPIAKVAVPKLLNAIAGENTRGGGEYLGLQSSWDNARNSLNYFTQYYADESYRAFKIRSVDEAGGEVCKNFASVVYPNSGELLDSLTTPRSPSQFTGSFEEIKMTTLTNPPTSHYKVYYHIYAGTDSGAYYQVYLDGGSSSSYYQDTSLRRIAGSGYINAGEYVSETPDFTAPSGYSRMCIVVNGQEECGFSQVSTSFAVNYVNDLYLEEQSTAKVMTEAECVSGTASLYSLLNPNAESIVNDLIDPALYQKGIIRVCATDNPGKGTDPKYGTEDSRWRDVGYCDNENIRCWIDTDSVKEAIKSLDIEESALSETSQNYLDALSESGNYISNEQYSRNITNIKSESDSLKKINLINEIIDKVFFNNQKAELFFLRGKAYGNLSITEFSKLEKIKTDVIDILEEEEIIEENQTIIETSDLRNAIVSLAEKTVGKVCGDTCYTSVRYLYDELNINAKCVYSAGYSKERSQPKCSSCGCRENADGTCYDCPREQYDLRKGDLVQVYNANVVSSTGGHNFIFSNWSDKDKKLANIFDSPGSGKPLRYREKYDLKQNPVTVIWEPDNGSSSSGNTNEINIDTDVVNINILTNKEKTVYNDAETCEDCSDTYYFGLTAESVCNKDLCEAIGKKLKLSCGFDVVSKTCEKNSSAYVSWTSYQDVSDSFNMFADDEQTAIAEAVKCSDCGNGALNICGKMECKAISLKLTDVDCEYKNLGCREIESSGDYSFSLNDLSNNQEYVYNRVTECSYCTYAYGYAGNVCDKNLCNAIGERINKDCVYNGDSCAELTYTGKYTLYCGLNIRETEYNALVEFLLRNEIEISDLNCDNVYVNNGHVVSLYLQGKNLKTLEGIEKLYRLRDLRLSQNNFNSGSISEIAGLSSLETLYLDGNVITNAYSLESLSKLKSVHLENNKLIEIEPLKELKNLEFLNVAQNCLAEDYDYSYFENKDGLSFSKLSNPKAGC